MKKQSKEKKALVNLENCRYFMLLWYDATLDSTKKYCCKSVNDGEENGNS